MFLLVEPFLFKLYIVSRTVKSSLYVVFLEKIGVIRCQKHKMKFKFRLHRR